MPAGAYSLTAVATDNGGLTTTSAAVPITVNAVKALYYIHVDHLNTPRLIADASGTTVWKWDQAEPFGSNVANEDPDGNSVAFSYPQRFPGQYFDAETLLHYNYFRDYDPGIGRYDESDPIGLNGGLNTYGYVRGNPLQNVDVDGRTLIPIIVNRLFGCYLTQVLLETCVYNCPVNRERCMRRPMTQCGYLKCQEEVLEIFTVECPDLLRLPLPR